jgi:exopolyphosphatase / guanosine-5'-triphosphate,3'-diphosphate pyrophosphatase
MNVAVIDVGSNTIRLLVTHAATGVEALREEKAQLGLGVEIERTGTISGAKLEEAAAATSAYAALARRLGAERLDVIVTSPGRQCANAAALVAALSEAAGVRARVLSGEEEGRLAFEGALAATPVDAASVGVCDVGGGSTQLVIGTPSSPVWLRSLDIGSLRLATRLLERDPPGKRALATARDEVRAIFAGVAAPLPQAALATGGTARALRKLVGRRLGSEELADALRILRKRPTAEVAAAYGLDLARARSLPAGALILAEVQRRLGVPLEVARAGLREGAALALAERAVAA